MEFPCFQEDCLLVKPKNRPANRYRTEKENHQVLLPNHPAHCSKTKSETKSVLIFKQNGLQGNKEKMCNVWKIACKH